jgi:hypothetical protein
MKSFFLFLWQLPQTILAYIVLLVCKIKFGKSNVKKVDPNEVKEIKNVYSVPEFYNCCVSLNVIIGQANRVTRPKTIMHEFGHRKQSQILGPLYLVFIGLPSFLGNRYSRLCKKRGKKFDYYKQPWEAWADKLGGVER